ncbi:MAG: hypothetical protein P4M00_08735 [Azospirillaceae bacterium]|nr:hypothetical protein [Azospirillaceae bacterium]
MDDAGAGDSGIARVGEADLKIFSRLARRIMHAGFHDALRACATVEQARVMPTREPGLGGDE